MDFFPNFFNFSLKHLRTCILTKFQWVILKISEFRTGKLILNILAISWKSAWGYVTNRPPENCKLHLSYCKSALFYLFTLFLSLLTNQRLIWPFYYHFMCIFTICRSWVVTTPPMAEFVRKKHVAVRGLINTRH